MMEYIVGAAKRSTAIEKPIRKNLAEFELDPARWAVVIVLIRESLRLICVDKFSMQRGILCRLLNKSKPNVPALAYVRCDLDRACPGFTLFAPQSGGGKVYLIDLEGNVTHTWQMPYPPGNSGYLTERGTLFYNGKTIEDSKRFISGRPWKGGAALEVDWNGRVLWEVRQPDHHHDGIRLRNGNVLLICLAQLPQDLVPKIKGGMPGTEHNGEMYADYLVEMTTDGKIVWEWRTWEHLDPETDCITAVQDQREEWTHGNGVAELPNGDIVLSFRNISTVIIIDRKTGEIIWKLGAPPLSGQHAPTPLP